jgi:carbamoyl-phosphate synthase large subunit
MTEAVLLSSAGRRVALMNCFRRAGADLGIDLRVLACDASPLSAAARIADSSFLVPRVDEPAFIDAVLQQCIDNAVRLVVPTIDPELAAYAARSADFVAAGITVAVSDSATIAIGSDKRATHAFLTDHGFPTVRQSELADVLAAVDDWTFPLIVKPPSGSAAIGVRPVASPEELRLLSTDDLVVQEYLGGVEVTVDVFVDRAGMPRCVVPRRRLEVRGGEVSKAVTTRSGEIIELVRNLCAQLPGAFGVLNVQVFWDARTSRLSVLEVNPRFGGGYPLTDVAGAPFARWLLQLALGKEPDIDESSWRDGVLMLRYDDAIFVAAANER